MGNLERQRELIAGFLSRKPAAETSFVMELQKWVRVEIRSNFPKQWRELADLEQSALLRVCEMRDDPQRVDLIQAPFSELAKYLVDAPARKARNVKRWSPLKSWQEPLKAPNQEAALQLKELAEIAESLPRGMAKTMLAQEALAAGDGPPLAEALGTDPRSARRRLARAQAAVLRIALGEDVEIPQEENDE